MTNEKIGYLIPGRHYIGSPELAYGLSLVMKDLPYKTYAATPKTIRYFDYLLVFCYWWQHLYNLAHIFRRAGIKLTDEKRPKILLGGFNTFNPVPFSRYADTIFIGDGEGLLDKYFNNDSSLEEHIYYRGKAEKCFWNNAEHLAAHSVVQNKRTRIEIARGCKYKCRFCAVAHLKKYRELPLEEFRRALQNVTTKRIAAFAPEPTLHSQKTEINELVTAANKTLWESDVRLDRLHKKEFGITPRFGLEGISEKLRFSVGKRYRDDFIVEQFTRFVEQGRHGIIFYVILDLPAEDKADWEAWRSLLRRIGEIKGIEDVAIEIIANCFLPNPHTAMEADGMNFERDLRAEWRGFMRSERWTFKLFLQNSLFSPSMRVLSMISSRAGEEFFDLENELTRKGIISISGDGALSCKSLPTLLRVLSRYGGVEKYCGPIPADRLPEMPWNCVEIPKDGVSCQE